MAAEGLGMLLVVTVANHTPGQGEGTAAELMHLLVLGRGEVHRQVVQNLSINQIKLTFRVTKEMPC